MFTLFTTFVLRWFLILCSSDWRYWTDKCSNMKFFMNSKIFNAFQLTRGETSNLWLIQIGNKYRLPTEEQRSRAAVEVPTGRQTPVFTLTSCTFSCELLWSWWSPHSSCSVHNTPQSPRRVPQGTWWWCGRPGDDKRRSSGRRVVVTTGQSGSLLTM